MRSFFIALTALTFVVAGKAPIASAQSQPPVDPVLSAYRDYRAAEQREDLPAAEAAAARALAASEARDGDGGSTAILAMNLAIVRMDMGHKADALRPAQRALELAHAGAKGVDELAARLTVGEIELTVDPSGDETHLRAALHDADARTDLDTFAYPAAVALAQAETRQSHWTNAMTAWQAAQLHIHGAPGDPNEALGNVLVGEAVALVGAHKDTAAADLLYRATELLATLAPESTDENHITAAEFEYAEAVAWGSVVRARQISEAEGTAPRRGAPLAPAVSQRSGLPALCPGSLRPTPLPSFPAGALAQYSVGAGVLRIETNDNGDITKTTLLAAVGGDDFRAALLDPHVHWSFNPDKAAPPGCRLASVDRLVVVNFAIGGPQ
jgi:hypothetical protein